MVALDPDIERVELLRQRHGRSGRQRDDGRLASAAIRKPERVRAEELLFLRHGAPRLRVRGDDAPVHAVFEIQERRRVVPVPPGILELVRPPVLGIRPARAEVFGPGFRLGVLSQRIARFAPDVVCVFAVFGRQNCATFKILDAVGVPFRRQKGPCVRQFHLIRFRMGLDEHFRSGKRGGGIAGLRLAFEPLQPRAPSAAEPFRLGDIHEPARSELASGTVEVELRRIRFAAAGGQQRARAVVVAVRRLEEREVPLEFPRRVLPRRPFERRQHFAAEGESERDGKRSDAPECVSVAAEVCEPQGRHLTPSCESKQFASLVLHARLDIQRRDVHVRLVGKFAANQCAEVVRSARLAFFIAQGVEQRQAFQRGGGESQSLVSASTLAQGDGAGPQRIERHGVGGESAVRKRQRLAPILFPQCDAREPGVCGGAEIRCKRGDAKPFLCGGEVALRERRKSGG